jgi:hypothetical protein
VQDNSHGAEGLRLGHKGSKSFLSGEDKQQVLEWPPEQPPPISRKALESYLRVITKSATGAAAVINYLETLQHCRGRKLWVIWDNASYHTSETVRQYLQKVNGQSPENQWPLTLWHVAADAPEQNPIEAVWRQGETKVRKRAGLNCFQQVKPFSVEIITENTCFL